MNITIPDPRYNITVQEYIEIIRDLVANSPVARVKDISAARGVTRSSVSTAMNGLRDLGLITHEHYGYIALTDEGKKLGEQLRERHELILTFLRDVLGLDPVLADQEACQLEHKLSPETLVALMKYVVDLQESKTIKSK